MTTQHTPGPWRVGKPSKSFANGKQMYRIAGPDYIFDYEDWGFTEPDARLMAAAPELLEVLKEFCECPQWVDEATVPKAGIDAAPQQVVVNMSVALMRIRKARAAIAKATGGEA